MKATVFSSRTASILSLSILFLAGCAGLSNVSSPATTALVYVLSNPSGSNVEIDAFSTDSKGQLTPVPGSPFAANVGSIAANRSYLFGTDGKTIYSFSIASNGALTQVSSINARQFTPPGYLDGVFLDHTGSTLYSADYDITGAPNGYLSLSIDGSTGVLTDLGFTSNGSQGALTFLANNQYGYTENGYHAFDGCPSFDSYRRNNDGTLVGVFVPFLDPPGEPPGRTDCPGAMAADQANHLAIVLRDFQGPGGVVLGVYSADSSGNLTPSTTFSDMPQVATFGVSYLEISPSGKFLAASGFSGLQVFQLNGTDPITPLTGLIPRPFRLIPPPPPGTIIFIPDEQILWDNDNNLYAINQDTNQLFVFTVTDTGATPAPGSPYTITNPRDLVVVSKM